MAADRAVLRSAFAEAGLGLVLLGADPLRPAKRINPGDRYRAMEQFFAASQTGAAGAAMMTSTASVQVNLEAGPQADWAARVRLAHALGPTMVAIAANSPLLGGKFTGWRSSRQWVWSQLDSARCGPILGANGDDPASDWARYAMKAPVMLVHPTPEMDAVPITDWVPFADWADGRVLLGDRRPTVGRSRLPPDDAVPAGAAATIPGDPLPRQRARRGWPALVFTLTTLLDDPAAADIAAEATEPVATAWDRAAQIGLGDRRAARGGHPLCAGRRRAGPCRTRGIHAAPCAFGRTGALPGRRLLRPGGAKRDRDRGHRTGARGAVTARESLAQRLTKARDRTLAARRVRRRRTASAVRPADEPAGVGPRAHRLAGRAVAAARQQPATGRACWLPTSSGSTTRSGTRGPAGSTCRCCRRPMRAPTARPCATRRSTRSTRCPTATARPQFNFGLVISHENQHDETMLQALNLRSGPPLLDRGAPLPAGRADVAGTSVLVPGGPFVLGVDAVTEPQSLDNERPAHVVDVPAFRIGRVPVTNGEWRRFVDDGGYRRAAVVVRARLVAPREGGPDGAAVLERRRAGRTRTRFGHVEDIPADEPVQHVTYFEAEAYAAWAGARLPTEIEWEKACAWDPQAGARRRFPWGASEPTAALANLGGDALRPAPVGAYPASASAYGAEQMLGDVWEWTIVAAAAVARLHADDLRPATASRSSTATTRCCAAGRGRSPPTSCGPASATGTIRSAGRSSAASAGLGRLMCRHLGWLGEPRSVASLMLDPPYGLLVQSYSPRRQKHGLMNADGWGVGFFDDDGVGHGGGAARPAVG